MTQQHNLGISLLSDSNYRQTPLDLSFNRNPFGNTAASSETCQSQANRARANSAGEFHSAVSQWLLDSRRARVAGQSAPSTARVSWSAQEYSRSSRVEKACRTADTDLRIRLTRSVQTSAQTHQLTSTRTVYASTRPAINSTRAAEQLVQALATFAPSRAAQSSPASAGCMAMQLWSVDHSASHSRQATSRFIGG